MFGPSIGFTGTQVGMTKAQRIAFRRLMIELDPGEFHHGDCIGADSDAHRIVQKYLPDCRIVIHPPIYESKRAFCTGAYRTEKAKDYLVRNRDIVAASSHLVATPKECGEQLRSGTWSTVRYARKAGIAVTLILPNI